MSETVERGPASKTVIHYVIFSHFVFRFVFSLSFSFSSQIYQQPLYSSYIFFSFSVLVVWYALHFPPPPPPPICLACHLNISFLFPTHVNQIYPSLSQNIWDWLLLGESLEGWHNQMENAFLATPYVSLVSKPKYMLWREVLHMFVEASSTSLGLDYTICITFWQKAEEIIQVSSQATESSQYKAKNIQQSFVLERPR